MSERRRLNWFIVARMIVVTLFYASTVFLYQRRPDSFDILNLAALGKLVGATYLFSLVSLAVLRFTDRWRSLLTYTQIIWDLLLVTTLILLTGGISSPYSFIYMLAIISASVLLARRQAFYAASLCAILYGGIIDLQYYGKLIPLGLSAYPAQQYGSAYLLYTIFVNIVAFYLTALLTGYLAERAKSSESALLEKVIDYEELERLNSSIVKNLTSGLLTVTPEGRVRVFNRYAEELTGISQQQAYDRPIDELIPGIMRFFERSDTVFSGEFDYSDICGNEMIFGYNAIRFFDKHGMNNGIILNFKDLTQIRQMEEELKRTDRLAAVGELAARIAHEIRNPLASISGSVQLIAQGNGVPVADRRLLEIVVRETDRLNSLISDFLVYARPVSIMHEAIRPKDLYVQLKALLSVDPRFAIINLVFESDDQISIYADSYQLEQVYWNLLVNAAEAMPGGGTITVTATPVHLQGKIIDRKDFIRIDVSDTGHGMQETEIRHLFEPFFTTKPGGTGLGLATVYRIIEAHGGRIFVDSKPGIGTTFSILLPAG